MLMFKVTGLGNGNQPTARSMLSGAVAWKAFRERVDRLSQLNSKIIASGEEPDF